MNTFKVLNTKVKSNRDIEITFDNNISKSVSITNFSIYSRYETVSQPVIQSINISDNVVTLVISSLYPLVKYTLSLFSTDSSKFLSFDLKSILVKPCYIDVFGIIEISNNIVKQNIHQYLKDNLYKYDEGIIKEQIDIESDQLSRALYAIGQVQNETFLSKIITEEYKTRGYGNTDRLNEESAYDVVRVSLNPLQTKYQFGSSVTGFNTQRVSLQEDYYSEIAKSIDFTSLIFKLTKPIIKVNGITFVYNGSTITYNVNRYGYYIYNYQFDNNAFLYFIDENQIRLDVNFFIENNIVVEKVTSININYSFKNYNICPVANTIVLYNTRQSIREQVEPLLNILTLKYNNIVDSDGNIATTGLVSFSNPINPTISHPAFSKEIPYNYNTIPNKPGYYSIDYKTGTVYVYGETTNNGSGEYPPLATYNYTHTYTENVDYSIDYDNNHVTSMPFGGLRSNDCNIKHSYDFILQNGKDYYSYPHKESLNESVNNKLTALDTIKTNNFPITNVFRIYNQTSGEIYTPLYWNYNKIKFSYQNAPALQDNLLERVTFTQVQSETLIGTNISTNIYKIQLQNTHVVSFTEDLIGSSINSSVVFSEPTIFKREVYFNRYTAITLSYDGDYSIDYENGVVYVSTTSTILGTVDYKHSTIQTSNLHIVKVNNIYYKLIDSINIDYNYFEDNSVILNNFNYVSDELSYKDINSVGSNYTYNLIPITNGYTISYIGASYISGVRNNISNIYGFYILSDLTYSSDPVLSITPYNFADQCSFTNNTLNIIWKNKTIIENVKNDGAHNYIDFTLNTQVSPSILINIISIKNYSNTIISPFTVQSGKILVPNSISLNTPLIITYTVSFDSTQIPVLNYSIGELYIDYTNLSDEIQVSYEYGENEIDFSLNPIKESTPYYVTYKVGALRDTLYKNFGSLVNIKELKAFDLDFDRELYRDCLFAALYTFSNGGTNTAIKNIAKQITKIDPELNESVYNEWALGYSSLSPLDVNVDGDLKSTPAIFGNGCLIDSQTLSLPATSNISLEQGTFESWIIPQWDGLDNLDKITITVSGTNKIFVGANMKQQSSNFTISKSDLIIGTPNLNNSGIYIFIDSIPIDNSTLFVGESLRWYIVNNISSSVTITVNTNNKFYSPTFIDYDLSSFKPISTNGFTSTQKTIKITNSGQFAFSFISDNKKYLLDVGESDKNRISIYKDSNGYINFAVLDTNSKLFSVSYNAQNWKNGSKHFIAASWNLATINNNDKLHLFIDGNEVPNYLTYSKVNTVFEKFGNISLANQIIGTSSKYTISGYDMVTYANSNALHTNVDLTNVNIGDIISIHETWSTSTYTITNIISNVISINAIIPYAIINVPFTINSQSFAANHLIFAYDRISISSAVLLNTTTAIFNTSQPTVLILPITISSGNIISYTINSKTYYTNIVKIVGTLVFCSNTIYNINTTDIPVKIYDNDIELNGILASKPDYSIIDDTITINSGISDSSLILLKSYGLTNQQITGKEIIYSSNNINILKGRFSTPINIDSVQIKGVLYPQKSITSSGGIPGDIFIHSGNNFTLVSSLRYCPNNITVSLLGSNLDFSHPITIMINNNSSLLYNIYEPVSNIQISSYMNMDFTTFQINGTLINPSLPVLFTLEIKDGLGITVTDNIPNPANINYYYKIDNGTFNSGLLDKYISSVALGGIIEINMVTLTSITILPTTSSINVGDIQIYIATCHYSDGSSSDITSLATWHSSNISLATVNNGIANSVSDGTVTITALLSGLQASATLNITIVLVSISITPTSASIPTGLTQAYFATGHYSDSSVANLTNSVVWSTGNISYLSVDSNGIATGISAGSTTIIATLSGINGFTPVTITAPLLVSISITPTSASIPTGLTQAYFATGHYSNGSTSNITTSATWSSSTSHATIASTGIATGVSAGSSVISASLSGITSNNSALTITATILFIILSGAVFVPVGLTTSYFATAVDSDGTIIDVTNLATWTSNNTSMATITNGIATGVSVGSTVISASFSGITSNHSEIIITNATLSSIVIAPTSSSISIGSTQSYAATGNYSDGSATTITTAVTWSSSTSHATIDSTGIATGVSVGSSVISASFSGITSNTSSLTITAPTLTSITISPTSATIHLFLTQQFTATGHYSDGSSADLTDAVAWDGNDISIVTASYTGPPGTNGVVTAVGLGNTTIRAHYISLGISSPYSFITVIPAL